MTCINCQRTNLPGGLRCAYCGTYLPVELTFDLEPQPVVTEATPPPPAPVPPGSSGVNMARAVGFLAPVVLLLMKLKSLLALLKFGKIATTLFSMFVFIWVDAQFFGWKFGVGIAVSIFLHEMGHVLVNAYYRLPQSAPVFIPFLGAAIFLKQFPDNPQIQAESGAGGPVAGFLTAIVCFGIYLATHDPFWLALAHFGFAVNLFNLIPFPPLDGSHIHAVFSPGIWNTVLIALLLWAIKVPGPMLWVILIASVLLRLTHKDDGRYLLARPIVRARMAALYLGLCFAMGWAAHQTTEARPRLRMPATAATAPATTAPNTQTPASVTKPDARDTDADFASTIDEMDATDGESLSESTKRAGRGQEVFFAFLGALLLTAAGLWSGTVALLARAQQRSWNRGDVRFLVGMVALLPVLLGSFFVIPLNVSGKLSILGAYFAGSAMAFGFAIFRAVTKNNTGPHSPTAPALRMQATVALGFGAFVVGYATDSLMVLLYVVLGIVFFYGWHRWMISATLGRFFLQIGDYVRAIEAFARAARTCPEPDEKAFLLGKLTELNITLDRGAAALLLAQERETLLAEKQLTVSSATALFDASFQASAYGLTGRFDEGLACCEAMLRLAGRDPRHASVLTLLAESRVHLVLAQFAYWRGWHDEALAQADWYLQRLSPSALTLQAPLLMFKALVLADRAEQQPDTERPNTLQQAEALCATAEKQGPTTVIRAGIAVVRSQIAWLRGDTETARNEAQRAWNLLPGHLACRYEYGRTIDSAVLVQLANDFPDDYWGRRAAQTSTSFSFLSPETGER